MRGNESVQYPALSLVCNQVNLFLGQLPKQLVIAFVDNESFRGAYDKNPFNFQNFNVNFIALYVDGVQVPSKPLHPDYANGLWVREYMQLVQTSGKAMKDQDILISRTKFGHGYTLYAFDLTPDHGSSKHYSLIKTGNLRAEICFAQHLPITINMIL